MKKLKVFSLIAMMFVFGMMALGSGSDSDSKKKEITSGEEKASEAVDDASTADDPLTEAAEVTIDEQVLI